VNILFVMYDQLRFDYLSCAGHPHLDTPNFDRVAAMGVRFTNAYVQSTICGASRMSFYTGRYVSSHGAAWNGFPLRVGEHTLGDHLRRAGMDCWLIGKTHMKPDTEGMERLGVDADSIIGVRQAECGFDAWVRDDGLWAQGPDGYYDERRSPYNAYLNDKGYSAQNPWADHANAGITEEGEKASGWMFAQCRQARQYPRGRQRNAVADPRNHRLHVASQGAMVRPCQLYQAALALYRACPIPQYVRAGACRPACRPHQRAGGSTSGVWLLYGWQGGASLPARRCAREGDPGLYGANQAMR